MGKPAAAPLLTNRETGAAPAGLGGTRGRVSRGAGLFAAAGLVLLAGCGTTQPKPDATFAPAQPVLPPMVVGNPGSIYQAGWDMRLFEDRRARRIGDILTVRLEERTAATKKAATDLSRSADVSLANPTLFGKPVQLDNTGTNLENNISGSQDFSGSGASEQSNSLRGDITVTVTEVLPNGVLRVHGEKVLTLNQGHERIQLSGLVRPEDIDANNSVPSTRLADPRIAYVGEGSLNHANRPGFLSRFFLNVWPF